MAILDFLVPDLAPEQYSSGQGTGYAQEYDLGAPNPFDVTQDYMNSMLQQKKLEQEKDLLNEKTRQEKLNQYISSIEYDPKWEIARSNFDEKVNEIGDFVSEWRASGKPINQDFNMELNKRKAELNTMKSENEKAFETYNKNMQTMLAGLGKDYNQEDIDAYEKSVTDAYEKGGINEGFKTITTIRPLKEFDLIGYLKKDYVVPENETGTLLETQPEELDKFAKLKWDNLPMSRKADQLEKLYLDGNIKEKTPEAAIAYFRDQVELWDKEQRARPRAPRAGGGGSGNKVPVFDVAVDYLNVDDSKRNLKKGDINRIKLQTGKAAKVIQLKGWGANDPQKEVIPLEIIPFVDGGVRKYKVRGIPFEDFKNVSGNANISADSQLSLDDINKYQSMAKEFPLSGYDNFEIMNQNYKGFADKVNAQEERDKKRGIKQEEKGFATMY